MQTFNSMLWAAALRKIWHESENWPQDPGLHNPGKNTASISLYRNVADGWPIVLKGL